MVWEKGKNLLNMEYVEFGCFNYDEELLAMGGSVVSAIKEDKMIQVCQVFDTCCELNKSSVVLTLETNGIKIELCDWKGETKFQISGFVVDANLLFKNKMWCLIKDYGETFLIGLVANALDATFVKDDEIAIDISMKVNAVIIYLAIILVRFVIVSIVDSFASQENSTCLGVSNAKWISTQDCFLFSYGTTYNPKTIAWTQLLPIQFASEVWSHVNIQFGDVKRWPTNLGWGLEHALINGCSLNGVTLALFHGSPLRGKFCEIKQAKLRRSGIVISQCAHENSVYRKLYDIVAGIWADKINGKVVMEFGVALWLIVQVLYCIAARIELTLLIVKRTFMGICEGVVMPWFVGTIVMVYSGIHHSMLNGQDFKEMILEDKAHLKRN